MRISKSLLRIELCVVLGVSLHRRSNDAAEDSAGRHYYVSVQGDDANDGSASRPLRTISAAAQVAQPGDVITVHEGVYRERINPPRGGTSEAERIVYQAAPGEKVVIKGSEVVKGWEKVRARHLEGDLAERLLRRLQSLQRPDPRRLVQSARAGSITPARSISTATG